MNHQPFDTLSPVRDFEDASYLNNHSDVKPAKLERLKRNLRKEDLDDDMDHYHQLGQYCVDQGVYSECLRLKKNIEAGIVKRPVNHPRKCKCGQHIIHHCIIQHIKDKYLVVIGRCCYYGITVEEQRKQMCSMESCNTRHTNKKYTVCNEHKKAIIQNEQKEKRKALKDQKIKDQEAKRLEEEMIRMRKEEQLRKVRERGRERARRDYLGSKVFGFGKRYRDTKIKDIPVSYIEWVIKEEISKPQILLLLEYNTLNRSAI